MDKRRFARIATLISLGLVLMLALCLPARGAYAQTVRGPKSAGALAVKGSKLVDKSGKAIQLRGVSTHGLAWFPSYVNDACFRQLRTKWGANVVRLAMYTQEYGGYCSGGNKKELLSLVKKGVRLAAQNDLYAIVDWHILSDGDPNTHVSEAKSFFANVSKTFAKSTNVIYEICNEPNDSTTWSDIKRYAKKVIPVIRKNDPDAVIIVGTPTWSQEVDKAAKSPLSYKNVLYALHFYAATHRDDLRSRMTSTVKGGLPVFVSEFGICDASGNGSIDKGSANAWVSAMNKLSVSWCMWSLCNKDESASILKSSCGASSGFKAGDLAASGKWLLDALGGKLSSGTAKAGGGNGSGSGSGTSSSSGSGSGTSATGGSGSSATASGKTTTFVCGKLSCKAVLVNSWPAQNGKTCYQYDLTVTNRGAARASWSVSVPFNKKIGFVNGWNGTYKASGCTLSIKSMDYNGSLAKGGTVSGVGFQVTSTAGLAVKK